MFASNDLHSPWTRGPRPEMNNPAEREPARVRTMVAQWEAWAKRAHVLPWIWERGSGVKVFGRLCRPSCTCSRQPHAVKFNQPAYGETAANAPKAKAKKRAKQ